MSTQFTPGPWYVNSAVEREPGKRSRAVHNVFNQDGLLAHIAECGNEDNARLVAASPELLDALIECERALNQIRCCCQHTAWDSTGPAVIAARAAIAKATGEQS